MDLRERAWGLHGAGDLEGAASLYAAALREQPHDITVLKMYGALLLQAGQAGKAADHLRQAHLLHPTDVHARANLGIALAATGSDDEAAPHLEAALAQDPGYGQALSALVLVRTRQGIPKSAAAACRRGAASAATPHDRRIAVRLLAGLGEQAAALGVMMSAAMSNGATPEDRRLICDLLSRPSRAAEAGLLYQACALCLADPTMPADLVAPAFCDLYRDHPDWDLMKSAALCNRTPDLYSDRTFHLGLSEIPLTDPRLEQRLTRFRRDFCTRRLALSPPPGLGVALALQCALTEYVWPTTDEEERAAERLTERLGGLDRTALAQCLPEITLLACYRRLDGLPNAFEVEAALADGGADHVRLGMNLLADPSREALLKADLRTLDAPLSRTSDLVRNRYEESPYPRWRRIDLPAAVDPRVFGRRTGARRLPERPDILIAGCGTGRHGLGVAARHPQAKVVGLDLSSASLAYADRRAREFDIRNIEFIQGDLLQIARLGRRFDYIECAGVLHHLAEPAHGLEALTGVLSSHGAIGLGLYSRKGRRCVAAARDAIRREGFAEDMAGLRAFRRWVTDQPADAEVRGLLAFPDFYTAPGCLDLAFHPVEHVFDLEEVATLLDRAGLTFNGFQSLPVETELAYRAQHPQDPAMLNLENWSAFEADQPQAFAAMYEFWASPSRAP